MIIIISRYASFFLLVTYKLHSIFDWTFQGQTNLF